ASWLAEDARVAARGADQPEQDLDSRGLASAVWTEKAEDLAWLDRQVEVMQRDLAPVGLVQMRDFDRGCQRRLSATRLRSSGFIEPITPYNWPPDCQIAALPRPVLSFSNRPG